MAPQSKPFKPPRAVNVAASVSRNGTNNTDATAVPEHSTIQPSRAISESDPEDDPFAPTASPHQEVVGETSFTAARTEEVVDVQAPSGSKTIPRDLLTRLLHEFMPNGIKMSKGADAAIGRYMDLFVREAVCRAQVEASEGRGGDVFLEVEDLEKLAPQLVLDF